MTAFIAAAAVAAAAGIGFFAEEAFAQKSGTGQHDNGHHNIFHHFDFLSARALAIGCGFYAVSASVMRYTINANT